MDEAYTKAGGDKNKTEALAAVQNVADRASQTPEQSAQAMDTWKKNQDRVHQYQARSNASGPPFWKASTTVCFGSSLV